MTSQVASKGTRTISPLDNPAIKEQFVTDLLELQKNWPNLSEKQRLAALQAAFDKTYTSAGYPVSMAPRLKFVDIGNGQLLAYNNAGNHTLDLNEWFVKQNPTISNELILLLGGVVMHEGEHAIQTRLVADNLASQKINGKAITAEEITKMTTVQVKVTTAQGKVSTITIPGISSQVAQAAIDDYKAGKRLTPVQVQEAKKLQASMFTSQGLSSRSEIAKKKYATEDAYNVAEKNYQDAIKRKAPAAETRKLLEIRNQAKIKAEAAFKAYQDIPEEKDAYRAQEKIESIIKRRQKLNPATRKKSASATRTSSARTGNIATSSNFNDTQTATNEKIAQGISTLANIKSATKEKEPEKVLVAAGNTKASQAQM
jgi:hypothetical protein